jgi:hypothetical protein
VTEPIRLRCLAGGVAPDDLVHGAGRVAKLTAAAITGLGAILRACVTQPMTPELGQRLSQFCLAHEVAEADLGHVVRVSRWLLREASAADLGDEDLKIDARALFGDDDALVDLLAVEYAAVRGHVRRELVSDALLKHGNVLVDVDWRVDVVAADRNALRLGTPIAVVTLAYKNADRVERLTLQLVPDQLQKLQQMFAALAQRTLRPMPER